MIRELQVPEELHPGAQEYEHSSRRRFFEAAVSGRLSPAQIYEQGDKLGLELEAQCYTIAFFSVLPTGRREGAEHYSEPAYRIHDLLLEHFLKYPEYILLRWNLTTYAVLIKGNKDRMEDHIGRCIETVQTLYDQYAPQARWNVAVATPVDRVGGLSACFDEVSTLWSYRHLAPKHHILTTETAYDLTDAQGVQALRELDVSRVDPAVWRGILTGAAAEDVPILVERAVQGLADALRYRPFQQFLMLSVRFTATEFVQSLGVSPQEFLSRLDCMELVGQTVSAEELKQYIRTLLRVGIRLREQTSEAQYPGLLQQAIAYIDDHYTQSDLSLSAIARQLSISPNYLSAVFSQEMGITMTEYITAKRMELACRLLRATNKRSGEIALAVGFRNPHYFSALFKKTQGCTPRDYRVRQETP